MAQLQGGRQAAERGSDGAEGRRARREFRTLSEDAEAGVGRGGGRGGGCEGVAAGGEGVMGARWGAGTWPTGMAVKKMESQSDLDSAGAKSSM